MTLAVRHKQTDCQKDKQLLSGGAGATSTEMSKNSHTCQGGPENSRKGKWARGERLLSEWCASLSGSYTELAPPSPGHKRTDVARSEGCLERVSKGTKHQEGSRAEFYLKHNLKGGTVTYFHSVHVRVIRNRSLFSTRTAYFPSDDNMDRRAVFIILQAGS